MKRKITPEMEKLYRLCHHDFAGKSYAEAAKIVGTSVRSVYRVLSEMKKLAPQLFPILTKEQTEIWKVWNGGHWSTGEIYHTKDIAAFLGLTEDALNSKLAVIRHKLGISKPHKRDTVRMSSSQMDGLNPDEITETF